MANLGKRQPPASREERSRLAAWVASTSDEAAAFLALSAAEVAALVRCSTKTLQRARSRRDELLSQGQEPDPLSLAALEYSAAPVKSLEVSYSMLTVKRFLRKFLGIPAEDAGPSTATTKRTAPVPEAFAGFLAGALPSDEWPFSIQADGRPVDLFHAIDAGLLTGKAERLTFEDFLARLAHTAPAAFHRGEGVELAEIIPEPEPKGVPAEDSKDDGDEDEWDGRL